MHSFKEKHKMSSEIYKIQILNNFLKIINIFYIFLLNVLYLIIQMLHYINIIFYYSTYYMCMRGKAKIF